MPPTSPIGREFPIFNYQFPINDQFPIFKPVLYERVFENLVIENSMKIVNWALKILVRRTRWVWATSPFARRYLGNNICFLFLWLLRCFTSPGSPHTPIPRHILNNEDREKMFLNYLISLNSWSWIFDFLTSWSSRNQDIKASRSRTSRISIFKNSGSTIFHYLVSASVFRIQ